jgi:vitamin B12 transporter
MRKYTVAMAALLAGMVSKAQDSTLSLNEVIVTANKFPQKQKNTGKVITVITPEELSRHSGRNVSEVLNIQAGLSIIGTQNTLGTNADVYLRGAGTGQTLILLDGVPVYDPSYISTAFDINLLTVDQVERIEILKGSHSTLYGSDAIAGVINIITKKGKDKPFNVSATLAAGTYDTYKGSVGLNGKKGFTSYNLQFTRLRSEGFSSAYDKDNTGKFDNDGFNQSAVLANIIQKINERFDLRVSGQYTKNKGDLDASAFTDEKDFNFENKNAVIGVGADYTLGKAAIHTNYSYNYVKRTYVDDSAFVGGFSTYSKGEYEGVSHFAEAYSNISLQKHLDLLVGVDYRNQNTQQDYLSISSFGPFKTGLGEDSASLKQVGAYASFLLKDLHGFSLELGSRYNSFNKYGNIFTFSLNPSYLVNDKVKFFANLSSGFKAPTLYQLYSEYANPFVDLKPEKSLSLDAGVQYTNKGTDVRVLYFGRSIRNNIVFFSEGAPNFRSYYINTDKQKNHGVEVEAKTNINEWHLAVNYTNVTGRIETKQNGKDTTINNLFRVPQNAVNLNLGYDFSKSLYASIGIRTVGKRFEAVFNGAPVELDPYFTWDAYASYQVLKQLKAFVDLKNLTNEKFFDVYGYNSRRFNFMAGLSLNF